MILNDTNITATGGSYSELGSPTTKYENSSGLSGLSYKRSRFG